MAQRILITGATGLLGQALTPALESAGHQVVGLGRRPGAGRLVWNPAEGQLDPADLEGFDVVLHLAGENIAGGRWTAAKKQRIRASRIDATELLCSALAQLEKPPQTLICASATGIYGGRGDQLVDESSAAGSGYLAELCQAWEAASTAAASAGIRVVHARIGVVLSRHGGALAKLLPPFRLGLGGRLGHGRQWFSWIELGDLAAALVHLMATDSFRGPVNLVSPHPVTNADFTRALGWALRRPTPLPIPRFVLTTLLGQMADELLFASTKVNPEVLLKSGFRFAHPHLKTALQRALAP